MTIRYLPAKNETFLPFCKDMVCCFFLFTAKIATLFEEKPTVRAFSSTLSITKSLDAAVITFFLLQSSLEVFSCCWWVNTLGLTIAFLSVAGPRQLMLKIKSYFAHSVPA